MANIARGSRGQGDAGCALLALASLLFIDKSKPSRGFCVSVRTQASFSPTGSVLHAACGQCGGCGAAPVHFLLGTQRSDPRFHDARNAIPRAEQRASKEPKQGACCTPASSSSTDAFACLVHLGPCPSGLPASMATQGSQACLFLPLPPGYAGPTSSTCRYRHLYLPGKCDCAIATGSWVSDVLGLALR